MNLFISTMKATNKNIFINIYELTHRVKEWVYTTGVTNFLSGQADHGRNVSFIMVLMK